MNSRKILAEQSHSLLKALKENQQQIQLEQDTLSSITEQLKRLIELCENLAIGWAMPALFN